MKHTLLTQLDSKISSIASELDQVQALTLAGLSISRLWTPFEKWALENKAPKLIERCASIRYGTKLALNNFLVGILINIIGI